MNVFCDPSLKVIVNVAPVGFTPPAPPVCAFLKSSNRTTTELPTPFRTRSGVTVVSLSTRIGTTIVGLPLPATAMADENVIVWPLAALFRYMEDCCS